MDPMPMAFCARTLIQRTPRRRRRPEASGRVRLHGIRGLGLVCSRRKEKAVDFIGWQMTPETTSRRNAAYVFIKSGYKLVKIMCDDILYIEGMRDFQAIYTRSGRILASHSFQDLEKILPDDFIRCHKSYLVSLRKIESIEKDRIQIGDQLIPIGESFKETFYKKL